MTDKRLAEDDVVAELRDGMTIGIGGWASRRKPMALVRAICRSPVKDLTVVSYGGPDVGLLCAYGKVRRVVTGFVSMTSIPQLKTIASPYDDSVVVAMPPLHLDVALVHMNRADAQGNAQYLGPDVYFDDLYCMAADKAFVSCERVVDDFSEGTLHTLRISRIFVDGVVEAPGGAR